MEKKSIPKGSYAVLTSAPGPVAKVVPEAWKQIWKLEDSSGLVVDAPTGRILNCTVPPAATRRMRK
jgi:predicted transcriptional regulator YdeE